MQHAIHSHHVNPRPHLPETPAALTRDVLGKFSRPQGTGLLVVSGVLVLLGIAGFAMRLSGGFSDRGAWGYYAAIYVFLLSTAAAAPILAVATRLTKGYWRKPLVRMAEMFTTVGILSVAMLIPILGVLPSIEGRTTFWMAWPDHRWYPQLSLVAGVLGLTICGLGLLFISAKPDLAAARDHVPGAGRGFGAWLATGWAGTPHQWRIVRQGVTYLGIFYLMMLVGVHFVVSVEMAITLVPGWRDPIFPAYHAISSLQAGLAMLVLTLGILRANGYKEYLALDQFWNPGKLLMSFSMLWFYFWWSGFIIFWYGRTAPEEGVMMTVMFGPTFGAFIVGFLCSFAVPLLMLMWNPVRVSFKGPVIASAVILVGNLFDRIRIYEGSFLVTQQGGHFVEHIPATRMPDVADLLVAIGVVGGIMFIYLIGMRIIPLLSLWELKEGQLLTETRHILGAEVVVIAKPE
ncbi:MAG: NrfD/PsrC family molybdoenzyme membrane anchor subunit [Chloroflexota bacterium]